MDKIVCGGCSARQVTQFRRCIFKKNINIFLSSKLEIATAISPWDDEK